MSKITVSSLMEQQFSEGDIIYTLRSSVPDVVIEKEDANGEVTTIIISWDTIEEMIPVLKEMKVERDKFIEENQ